METGECSGAKLDDTPWAKLVPSDSRYSDIDIKSSEMIVCSEVMGTSSEKHEWCKITRGQDLISATIKNISATSILVGEAVLGKEESTPIKCGNEIIAGPNTEGYLIYIFKLMLTQKLGQNNLVVSLDVDHMKCSICLNVWHDVVTVAPCLHNFCNGCFSEWLNRLQRQQKNVVCPQCRADVYSVGRNHFLHNIEEALFNSYSSLRRSTEELTLLDTYASIKSNLVIRAGKRIPRKRPWSASNDENYQQLEALCPQCDTELGGFRCNRSTSHLQCQACWGMMPSRPDIGVPQHCIGCNRAFCGAYWRAQGVVASDIETICSSETFLPISEHCIFRLPSSTHENNGYEQNITESCIGRMGKTLQEVISEWIMKMNNREIDRARMPLSHAEMITARTYVCYGCYEKLVTFLLYWFRVSMPKSLLPADASRREDCWYGYECRTQHHNDDHARKRNHVCRPTRGTHRT